MTSFTRKDIPEVKLIPVIGSEPISRQKPPLRRGRTAQILAPVDIRWPLVQEYLRSSNLSPNSRKLYERELKRFLGWTQFQWADLKQRHLGQYKAYLMELRLSNGKKLSKNSLNSALTALKSFFKWLCSFTRNCAPVTPPKG